MTIEEQDRQPEPAAESSSAAGQPLLRIGEVVSVGGLSHGRLLSLVGVAPDDTADPVVLAARHALRMDHPEVQLPQVDAADVEPATPDNRFTLVRVRGLQLPDGTTRDIMVMRGEMKAVMKNAHAGRQALGLLRKNADYAARHGGRPLVIAAAPVGLDGSVGPYKVQGFVAIHPHEHDEHEDETSEDGSWVRVNLWSASLRWQHWLNVVLIFVMSCTGYYIMDPFFGPTAGSGQDTGFLMGYVRMTHFICGFAWLLVGFTRIVSAFTSRDRYLRWPTLWPLKSKADMRNLVNTIKHYTFIKKEGPLFLAHNPLQQLTYTGLYLICAVQMATGFTLYGLYHQDNPFWAFISTPIHWIGVPIVRLIHTMIMFLLWVFVIVHVYLAVRADTLERHGGVSAMMNGGVWLRRGSRPVDSPEIE